eukprot:COSAG05_NODE_8342_length_712_cov_1.339315_1_plen_76_part_10
MWESLTSETGLSTAICVLTRRGISCCHNHRQHSNWTRHALLYLPRVRDSFFTGVVLGQENLQEIGKAVHRQRDIRI